MGEKYEALPFRTFYGYHDPSRPTEALAGLCEVCGLNVFLIPPDALIRDSFRMKVVHWSCR